MIRRPSRLVVVLALVGALSLAVSTGAVSWSGADMLGDTGANEELMMEPTSEYAYLNDDNETVIDLSRSNDALDGNGVAPNARTTLDDVAALRYNGSEYATVYVTHDSDAITITNDGQPINAPNDSVNLTPEDRTVSLDLVIDTTNTSKSTLGGTLTIHAEGSGETTTDDGGSNPSVGVANNGDNGGDRAPVDDPKPNEEGPEDETDEEDGTENETDVLDGDGNETDVPDGTENVTDGANDDTTEDTTEDTPEETSETATTSNANGETTNNTGTATGETESERLIEEPAAISLDRLLGVATTGLLALALIMLIRRAPV